MLWTGGRRVGSQPQAQGCDHSQRIVEGCAEELAKRPPREFGKRTLELRFSTEGKQARHIAPGNEWCGTTGCCWSSEPTQDDRA